MSPSRLHRWLDRSWLCLVAGSLMGLAYAPFGWWWAPLLLLQPLWVAARHPHPNVRIWRGWLFGLGYFPVGAWWFVDTLREHIGYGWPAALGGHLLITGACALAPTVVCWLAGYIRTSPARWVVATVALWVVVEDIRFQAFGGGPWMSLGLSQVNTPLAGFYPLIGELGTSFIVCLLAGFVWWLSLATDRPARLVKAGMVVLGVYVCGWGLQQIMWTAAEKQEQTIALVQSAVAQSEKQDRASEAARLQELAALTRPHLHTARLIIWPETVVTLDRSDIHQGLQQLQTQAMRARSTILLGAYEPSMGGQRYNTAFTLGYEAGQVYHKRHLVPFGEYVPRWLSVLTPHVPGDSERHTGRGTPLIANTGVLYGVSICWEGSFSRDMSPLVRAGAHVLVNIANEAWFAGSSLPPQNLDAMRVRAMETGRDVIRVANYGPGAIINSEGQITQFLAADRAGSVAGTITPRSGMTPFVLLGQDFISLCCLGMIVVILFGRCLALFRKEDKKQYA